MERSKKIIFITGSNGGIGKALLKIIKHSKHYSYILHVRNKKGLKELRTEGLVEGNYFLCDLSNISELKKRLSSSNLKADILINNAGIYDAKSIFDFKADDIVNQLNINLISNIVLTNHFLRKMKRNRFGRIVNISSGSGNHGGILPSLPYAVSKNALNYMSDILPKEIGKYNIKINTFILRFVNTKMLEKLKNQYKKMTSIKLKTDLKIHEPEVVARIILSRIMKDDLNNGEIVEIK